MALRPIIAWLLPCCLIVTATSAAADLREQTTLAYERIVQEAIRDFRRQGGPVLDGRSSDRLSEDEVARVAPGRYDGIVEIPGGLVHHWKGHLYIRGVTLAEALDLSCAYEEYHLIYRPVVDSALLSKDGNTYRVRLRVKESAGGLSAVLDVTSRVQYFFPGPGTVYSMSTSEEIREVEHPGTTAERLLPPGHDSGYLWRATTLNRLSARNGGVLLQMETLGLSRAFPPLLGWIIEPIARRLGRKSIELSLQQFRDALLVRNRDSK